MLVQIRNLRKTYGNTKAVNDISFSFGQGESFGFVGPNGAGKSTTMRVLAALEEPSGGECLIDGVSVIEYPDKAYRLVGYENRLMKHEDFNDDKKDAGDMGSGHTVTALYEIVPVGIETNLPAVDPLRYQDQPAPVPVKDAAKSNELMMVKVRYKDPGAEVSKLLTQPVIDSRKHLLETSVDFRFAAAVAEFALILRDSPHKGTANLANVITQSRNSIGPDFLGHRAAFVQMAEATRALLR